MRAALAALLPAVPTVGLLPRLPDDCVVPSAATIVLPPSLSVAATVQIGISFRSKQGHYCRTFSRQDSASAAGLACHETGGWTVQILAHDVHPPGGNRYRQAASVLPAPVLRAVDDAIGGDPLDATAEAQARASGCESTQ